MNQTADDLLVYINFRITNMLEMFKRWLCGKDEEELDVRTTPMKWTVHPESAIYHLIGEVDTKVKIGVRGGIVCHKDGVIRIVTSKNGQKETFFLTMDQLYIMGYIAPYRILS